MSSPFTHIPTPHAPQLVNLPPDPPLIPRPSYIPASHSSSNPTRTLILSPCCRGSPSFAPQSAVLFLESLLGQENVYTVAMVRNPPTPRPGATESLSCGSVWQCRESKHDCGVDLWLCCDVCMGTRAVAALVSS